MRIGKILDQNDFHSNWIQEFYSDEQLHPECIAVSVLQVWFNPDNKRVITHYSVSVILYVAGHLPAGWIIWNI